MHKFIFVKQTNEPIREKEHVDIRTLGQMQVKWQTFVSYFRIFQMSVRLFGNISETWLHY